MKRSTNPKDLTSTSQSQPHDWQEPIPQERWPLVVKVAIMFICASYVVARILMVPLTNDEWGSLKDIYRQSFGDLFSFAYVDAQNHFLIGLLSMIALRLAPAHEVVAIRLPTVLGYALFLLGAFKLTAYLRSLVLRVVTFLALSANAFQMDFFSLSRGYGLSLTFTMLALWGLVAWIHALACADEGRARRFALLAIWSAFMAVMSNLSFLICYVAFTVVLLFWPLLTRQKPWPGLRRVPQWIADHGFILYNAALLGIFYLPRVILLVKGKRLYFGGTEGFVEDSVQSLVRVSAYDVAITSSTASAIATILVVLFAACVAANVWTLFRRSGLAQRTSSALACAAILALIVVISVLQHELLGIKFVLERAALFLLPIFVCHLAFTADAAPKFWPPRLMSVLLAAYAAWGVINMNLTHTYSWRETSQNPALLDRLHALHAATDATVVIGMSDGCKYTTWYYAERKLGLKEDPRTKDNGFVKKFGWLVIYSADYGIPPGGALHFLPETTHLYVQNQDAPRLVTFPVKAIGDYAVARCRLYERIGPATSLQTQDAKP